MINSLKNCQCYVKELSEHEQLMLRFGAHVKSCRVFRESLDPVDRMKDNITRMHYCQLAEMRMAADQVTINGATYVDRYE